MTSIAVLVRFPDDRFEPRNRGSAANTPRGYDNTLWHWARSGSGPGEHINARYVSESTDAYVGHGPRRAGDMTRLRTRFWHHYGSPEIYDTAPLSCEIGSSVTFWELL